MSKILLKVYTYQGKEDFQKTLSGIKRVSDGVSKVRFQAAKAWPMGVVMSRLLDNEYKTLLWEHYGVTFQDWLNKKDEARVTAECMESSFAALGVQKGIFKPGDYFDVRFYDGNYYKDIQISLLQQLGLKPRMTEKDYNRLKAYSNDITYQEIQTWTNDEDLDDNRLSWEE